MKEEEELAAMCLAHSAVCGIYEGRFDMVKKKKTLLKAGKEKVVKERKKRRKEEEKKLVKD